MVRSFKYLRGIMMASEEYCPEAVGNLQKARKSWAHMPIIFRMEGDNQRVPGMFFKALMQAVLIFGAETWVMTPCVGPDLGSFNTG